MSTTFWSVIPVMIGVQRQCRVGLRKTEFSAEVFPLLFLICEERNKARVLPEIIQVRIAFEQRVTRKTITRRILEPGDCLIVLIHECIRTRDVICGVMEVTKPLSFFYR